MNYLLTRTTLRSATCCYGCSCTVYTLSAVVSFTCWSCSCIVYLLYAMYCLRVEVGLTRLHVGGGVGMSLPKERAVCQNEGLTGPITN